MRYSILKLLRLAAICIKAGWIHLQVILTPENEIATLQYLDGQLDEVENELEDINNETSF